MTLRRLMCWFSHGGHDWKWFRKVYGDEINAANGKRAMYVCRRGCGAITYRHEG